MGKLFMLDPRVSVELTDHALVQGLATLKGRTIGILDNGQANSTPMFHELATLLKERHKLAAIIQRKKPTHMQGASNEMLDELANGCDAVITGLGA